MTADLRDDLDRAIDEALSAAVAGEPRRVDAASVRQALDGRDRSLLPFWFGLAAAIVIALGGFVFVRQIAKPGPSSVASRPLDSVGPGEALAESPASTFPSPGTLVATGIEPIRRARARPAAAHLVGDESEPRTDITAEPPYEGFPRLAITPLTRPASLSPVEFEDRALSIAAIEIPPLTLAGLSSEQEQ